MIKRQKQTYNGLPYVDNWQMILLVLAVNMAVVLALYLLHWINLKNFIRDAWNCGVTTSLISVAFVYPRIRRLRAAGALPGKVLDGKALQRLPQKPLPLALVLSVIFALLMAAIAWAIKGFYEIDSVTPLRFLAWKLVYTTLLSVKLIELVVLRLVQPDCAQPGEPEQIGTAVVKNPLPRKETFGNLFHTMTEDFGFNLIIGLLLGGTVIQGHTVIIAATTRSGIVIGGLILGLLVALRMVYPVAKSIRALRDAGQLPPLEKRSLAAYLPEKPTGFALALLIPTMAVSVAVLWAVLTFFGFEELNFFQYYVIRALYVALLSKGVVMLAVHRYRQPGVSSSATEAPGA